MSFAATVSPALASQPGGDYNIIPYVSVAFPQSQPARLAALAALFGLSPYAVETAKVLELGCASGGNIIPLAARFPNARFLGIDLSTRHVADGKSRVARLGLGNVEIRQGDLTAFEPRETFDYIICHGVYSWVPPAARDAIFRICRHGLSANGVAYISYNVFPGWQIRKIIRDIMLFHAGDGGPPAERIAKARWVLEQMAKFSPEGSPHGAALRQEAAGLSKSDDAYLLGEFLAAENAPCYFRDFNAEAEKNGLVYLCESEVHLCIPENRGADFGQLVRAMSGNKLVPLEQYIDFFAGRTFRQTLLVKAERAKTIQRTLLPDRAAALHVAGRFTLTVAKGAASPYLFRDSNGATMATGSEIVRAALEKLSAAFPETRTLAELKAEIAAGTQVSQKAEAQILDAIFQMILIGMAKISSTPIRGGRAGAERPAATALARADAADERGWTTGPMHETAAIDVVCAALLPHMDGSNDRAALGVKLLEAVRAGRIGMRDNATGAPLSGGAALDAAIAEHVELALGKITDAGLLVPEPEMNARPTEQTP